MSEATAGEQEHVAELMAQIGDRYLLMIRENYLDDPSGVNALRDFMVDSLRELLHTGRFSCVYDLACSSDWRGAVVGLHYAILLACPAYDLARPGRTSPKAYQLLARQVGDKYEGDLRNGPLFAENLAARPAFLLFTLQNRHGLIIDFLAADRPSSDAADTSAAALVSEKLTRVEGQNNGDEDTSAACDVPALRESITARLRAEPWHDARAFSNSEQRFLQSWWYWTKENP